jgi:hypothetical protein
MAGVLVVSAGCIAAAAGAPLLWLAWKLPPARKAIPRIAGWLLILASLLLLGIAAGAWGIAVSATATSASALLILAYVGAHSVPARRTSTREAAIQPLNVQALVAGLPRRFGVFLLVVPGGIVASTIVALGARAAATRAGWGAADSTMAVLGGMPLVWSIIASLQMTQSSLVRMAAIAVVPALAGGLLGIAA